MQCGFFPNYVKPTKELKILERFTINEFCPSVKQSFYLIPWVVELAIFLCYWLNGEKGGMKENASLFRFSEPRVCPACASKCRCSKYMVRATQTDRFDSPRLRRVPPYNPANRLKLSNWQERTQQKTNFKITEEKTIASLSRYANLESLEQVVNMNKPKRNANKFLNNKVVDS